MLQGSNTHGSVVHASLKCRLIADKTSRLYAEAIRYSLSVLSGGCIMVIALWAIVDHGRLLVWLTLFLSVMLLRFLVYFYYREKFSQNTAARFLCRYAVTVVLTALVWGGTALVVYDQSHLVKITTLVFLSTMVGAGLGAYSIFPWLSASVAALMLLPFGVILLLEETFFATWMALAFLLYGIAVCKSAYVDGRRIEQALLLKYELEEANRIAKWHAETDVLTGLKNRRAFVDAATLLVRSAMLNGRGISLLVIDLDRFKHINDAHGHSAGDRVLSSFGEVLRKSLRDLDVCGRVGGDEFVVLLPETTQTDAFRIGERIRAHSMEASVQVGNASIAIALSIGIASGRHDSFDGLFALADHAMYEAKNMGINHIVVARETYGSNGVTCVDTGTPTIQRTPT